MQNSMNAPANDNVNHPAHYTRGKIECIDYILDQKFDFLIGNAIKYLTRAGYKNDEVEDLKKAIFYINRKIDQLTSITKE